jgi:glycosyltransferase involved in cell wall biosynthesis
MADRMTSSLRVDRKRVAVIPNWSHVTASDASPADAKQQLGWPSVFTALHAGNLGRKQGLEVIVEAARAATAAGLDMRFVLLGDGSERERLEHLAAGVPCIEFMDPFDAERFPVALAAADVLLVAEMPGVAEMAAPSKLTSYFAAARPVVASVSPYGIVAQTMAKSGAGPVVEGGDGDALCMAVEQLSKDPAARDRAATRAREYWQSALGPGRALSAWDRVVEATILGTDARGEEK